MNKQAKRVVPGVAVDAADRSRKVEPLVSAWPRPSAPVQQASDIAIAQHETIQFIGKVTQRLPDAVLLSQHRTS